jgi:hypothetical protein
MPFERRSRQSTDDKDRMMKGECEAAAWYLWWVCQYPGIASIIGSTLSALIAVLFAIYVTHHYTKKSKQHEILVYCSGLYEQFSTEIHSLNREFYFDADGKVKNPRPSPSQRNKEDAWSIHHRLFNLMLNQFYYFQSGLINEKIYEHWALRRWYDWDTKRALKTPLCGPGGLPLLGLVIVGVSYTEGWRTWSDRPAVRELSFVKFMNELHGAQNEVEAKRLIKGKAPRWWRLRSN